MTYIAQLTDLHIKANGALAYGTVDTLAALQNSVRHIAAFKPAPSCVVISGDVGDFGTAEEYALVRAELKKLSVPLLMVPGNHDTRSAFRSAFAEFTNFTDSTYCNFVHITPDGVLIGLDTLVENEDSGEIPAAQLQALDHVLTSHSDKHAIIFMHHHPVACGLSAMDNIMLKNPEAFARVISKHPSVQGIICGHVHREIVMPWHNTTVFISPGNSHAVTLNLEKDAPNTLTIEPPAIRLLILDEGKLTSHLSFVRSYPGPFPFCDVREKG